MDKKIYIAVLAGLLGLGLFTAGPAWAEQAPDLSLVTLEGQPWRLADYKGRVVLLNFFTPWCTPCKTEAANLLELRDEFQSKGLTVVGLAYFSDPKKVLKYLEETKIDYPVAIYGDNAKRALGETKVVPVTYLVDRKGELVGRIEGMISKAVLKGKLLELLNGGQ